MPKLPHLTRLSKGLIAATIGPLQVQLLESQAALHCIHQRQIAEGDKAAVRGYDMSVVAANGPDAKTKTTTQPETSYSALRMTSASLKRLVLLSGRQPSRRT
jgi:hypothetical protein